MLQKNLENLVKMPNLVYPHYDSKKDFTKEEVMKNAKSFCYNVGSTYFMELYNNLNNEKTKEESFLILSKLMNLYLEKEKSEKNEFHYNMKQNTFDKLMEDIEKNISNEGTILIAKEFFKDCDIETIKLMINETKKDNKEIATGKAKSYFPVTNINNGSSLYKYVLFQNKFKQYMSKKETKRAWEYLNDKETSFKYGFVDEKDFKPGGKYFGTKMPKQTEEMAKEWAEKSMAKIQNNLWENQFDLCMLIAALK